MANKESFMEAQNSELQAVVAGHICCDIIPSFKKAARMEEIFMPGKLVNMGGAIVSTGGPVSNTGAAMSILGVNTALMGKIGDDFFGDGVMKLLRARNAESGMIIAKGEQTSYTVVIAPPGIDRVFLHNPGANDTFCADDIDYETVKRAKLFHFGYPPLMKRMFENNGTELIKIFKRVKKSGVTTSLDMSLPDAGSDSGRVDWERVLSELLPCVDIYLPSVEETMFMLARHEYNELNRNAGGGDMLEKLDLNILQVLGEKLIALGSKIAVIKCGVHGYYIRTANAQALSEIGKAKPAHAGNWAGRELHEEGFHVSDVASATGSGDSSIAGFLAAYLNGKSIEEAIRIACAVGGQNVRVFDALSGIKSWQETLEMIPGWDKNRHEIQGEYWRYDRDKAVWVGKKDGNGK